MQVMKECLMPQLFDEVLLALWGATCEVLEGFLLASLPSQSPLSPSQVTTNTLSNVTPGLII
jgi:hypothetical protein